MIAAILYFVLGAIYLFTLKLFEPEPEEFGFGLRGFLAHLTGLALIWALWPILIFTVCLDVREEIKAEERRNSGFDN
jgi:hypothetical protein